MWNDYDYLFKIVVLGDRGVGKSNLILRYCQNIFSDSYISTIGVDFLIKTLQLEDKTTKLQIWDTNGQLDNIDTSLFRSHVIILAFDLTNIESFNNCAKWLEIIPSHFNGMIILVGNKADLENERVVDVDIIEAFIQNNK